MIITHELTIPADTAEANAVEENIQLAYGTLTKIWVCFPPGPFGWVYVAVLDKLNPLCPAVEGQSLHWDGYPFEFNYNHKMHEEPFELTVKGWSPGALFEHTITLIFELQVEDERELNLLERLVFALTLWGPTE